MFRWASSLKSSCSLSFHCRFKQSEPEITTSFMTTSWFRRKSELHECRAAFRAPRRLASCSFRKWLELLSSLPAQCNLFFLIHYCSFLKPSRGLIQQLILTFAKRSGGRENPTNLFSVFVLPGICDVPLHCSFVMQRLSVTNKVGLWTENLTLDARPMQSFTAVASFKTFIQVVGYKTQKAALDFWKHEGSLWKVLKV